MTRTSPRTLAIALISLVVAGCNSTEVLSPRPSPTPSAELETEATAPETKIATRELHFGDVGDRGRVQYRLPYGRTPGTVGYADVCTGQGCQPPCPCEVPIMPYAFDIDPSGRVWILDPTVPRIAVFDRGSRGVFDVPLGDIGHRGSDLQMIGEQAIATFQDLGFKTIVLEMSLEGDKLRTRHIKLDGKRIDTTGLDVVGDEIFSSAFVGPLEEVEQFVEIELPPNGPALATEAEGWPLGAGLLRVTNSYEELTIPLDYVAPVGSWSKKVRFVLRQRVAGETKSKNGSISWADMEIDPEGAIHLVVFAGTYGGQRDDGSWYLKVGPNGTVGRPIRLRDPERDDQGQAPRRLTLDARGTPFAMWADRGAVVIESLALLEQRSLPNS